MKDVILADTRPKQNKWTEEEDAELIRMVGEMGKQWLKISKAMGGVHSNDQVPFHLETVSFFLHLSEMRQLFTAPVSYQILQAQERK